MTDEAPATAEEVVAFFQRQREKEVKKIMSGVNAQKFSPSQLKTMSGNVRFTVGGKPCVRPTPARIYLAKDKLLQTSAGLREVDPRKIINAVAVSCRMEPLTIARLWPEISRRLAAKPQP